MGNRHPSIAPYDTFAAQDGDFVLAVGNDQQWRRCCTVIGREDLGRDERFATNALRVANYDALREIVAPLLLLRARGDLIASLRAAGVPCGSVRDVAEALDDPQLAARQIVEWVEHAAAGHLRVLGLPVKLSATPGTVRTAPPTLGQHTDVVLLELGFGDGDIAEVRRHSAV